MSGEQHPADARRRAEEALVFMDAALLNEMPPLPTQVKALADSVRALLNASALAAARKEAEEALATVAQRYPNGWGSYDTLSICTSALRSLLAAAREAEAPVCRLCHCCGDAPDRHGEILAEWVARADQAEAALAEERRRREEDAVKAELTGLPVHFVSLLPRGSIFMHPDTPKSGVRDPWPPTMPTQEAPR